MTIKENLRFDRSISQFRYRPDEVKKRSDLIESEILLTPKGICELTALYDEFQPHPDDADRLIEDLITITLESLWKVKERMTEDAANGERENK